MKFLSVLFMLCYLHYSISKSKEPFPGSLEPNRDDVSDSVLKLIEEKVKHIETFFDDIQKQRQPINISNVDMTKKLKPLKGNWVLDKIILKDYYNWDREPTMTEVIGTMVVIAVPFYWPDYINIEIDHNGEFVIAKKYLRGDNDMIIKIENSKLLVSMKGLRLTVIMYVSTVGITVIISPDFKEVDLNSTVTGIYVDGEPSGHPVEKIIRELQNQQELTGSWEGGGLSTLVSGPAKMASEFFFVFGFHVTNQIGSREFDIESFANMDMQIFDEKLKILYQNMNVFNFMEILMAMP